ncbi:MAG: hypothetical protein KF689_10625 [Gemmatimonadaceae bacterium]|nr:hypothetical protein [Gemmatimonadaceae bacterium]MCW5825947.1 hypothetical protein [Gemmatimonadaceae bacterium]
MRRSAIIASILLLLSACDKQEQPPRSTEVRELTDLSGSPTLLFTVFGPVETPKLAPLAVVRSGGLEPLVLDEAGWQQLDAQYFAAGMTYPVYRNGAEVGNIRIVRGMWPADSAPLYEVPGCARVVPHALGSLESTRQFEETVELLAATSPLPQPTDTRPLPANPEAQGLTLASAVAAAAGVGPEDLSSLDYHARWLRTGAGFSKRTLLASYIDPSAGDLGPGAGNTAVLVLLAEDSAGTFQTSYQHARSGEARSVEFRRLVNYADLSGDGVAELVMETWRYAGIPELVVMRYGNGRWTQSFGVSQEWCTDRLR